MNTKANNSLAETGPMATTNEAVDYLMRTSTDIQEDTTEEAAYDAGQEGDTQDVQQTEHEPETDAQADDEGEEYDAEGTEEGTEDEAVTHVQIGDKEVSIDELAASYERQADYTRKMQLLAKERKDAEHIDAERKQEIAAIKAEREHLRQMLSHISQTKEKEPDWLDLAENDPLEYTRQKAMHDAKMSEKQAIQAEQQRLNSIAQQENQARFKEFAEQQKQAVLDAIPELKTDTKYMSVVETYLEGTGYSKAELSRLFDSRTIILADKARKYDELMGNGKPAQDKRVKPKGKVVKPSMQKSSSQKVTVQRNKAMSKLKSSGSINDAVNALLS